MADSSNRVVFKKRGNLATNRKRDSAKNSSDEEHESEATSSSIVKFKKRSRPNAMIQTSSKTKALASKAKANDSTDSNDEDASKPEIHIVYKADRTEERTGPKDMGATATLEIETEHDKDAQAQFERLQAVSKEILGKADDKVYRGKSAYGQFFEKKDTALGNASSGLNRKGPIRAPTFVRQSVRWDYAPDICKDYKETGFCGFGDSCKFLHDRSDYKHGWEIEREYSEGRYGANDEDPHKYEIIDEEETLPFKCLICRETFVDPIVTKCKHYFCEKCALGQFRKTHKCFVCEKGTSGIFHPAKEIIARMKGETLKRRVEESDSSESESETKVEKLEEAVDKDESSGDDNGSAHESDEENDV